ncbi:MAG: hypothetical protein HKN33_18195 [Pyrinomonadaceae bacterium]|nr:hypothetical protein [Pyrinomonadaceae bacterium]
MKKGFWIVLICIALSIAASAQQKLTENTLRMEKDKKGESATVADMEWIAGNWGGKALGGNVHEVWTKTDSGQLMGMFSLEQKDKPVFYEFLIFTVEDGQLLLKLKHFNPDLTGWEEKDKFVTFRFIKRDGKRFYFSGLTFENTSENETNIYLALRMKDKSVREESFPLKRLN